LPSVESTSRDYFSLAGFEVAIIGRFWVATEELSDGSGISVLDSVGAVRYSRRKTANTRPADAALIQRASRFAKKLLPRESGVSQHAIDRFFDGERFHPATRKKLADAVAKLERERIE
jgi:hypothetical protein